MKSKVLVIVVALLLAGLMHFLADVSMAPLGHEPTNDSEMSHQSFQLGWRYGCLAGLGYGIALTAGIMVIRKAAVFGKSSEEKATKMPTMPQAPLYPFIDPVQQEMPILKDGQSDTEG